MEDEPAPQRTLLSRVVVALLIILVSAAIIVMVLAFLLGPTIGNVYSDNLNLL